MCIRDSPSIVDPLTRHNPGNNTGEGVPNIEYQYHPGQEYVDFIISFKGCGAELGNAMKIFTTANLKLNQDFAGLKRFVLETAINAGGKPCPPDVYKRQPPRCCNFFVYDAPPYCLP